MIHFGTNAIGRPSVWGTRVQNLEYYSGADTGVNTPPLTGQYLGGIGFFRTGAGQPRDNFAGGAYLFDNYSTVYAFANGQYSLAIQVIIALSEMVNMTDLQVTNSVLSVSLSSGVSVADTLTSSRVLSVTLSDGVVTSDTYLFESIYGIVLSESLLASDTTSVNTSLIAYAVNINNSAVSTYNNFNFNSFAKIGNNYYGANGDGVFLLSGDTDDGVLIDAGLRLGTNDLATEDVPAENLKRLPAVYIGVNTTGDLMLKVTANGVDNFYTLSASTSSSLHTGRMLLGKGVAARYWDFELTNVSGADFTLESITLMPVALGRRVV